jgi:elongation factor P--beta-lysine ligase
LLTANRAFFGARGVLEVDTPQLVNHAVTDRHLHSAQVRWPARPRDGSICTPRRNTR